MKRGTVLGVSGLALLALLGAPAFSGNKPGPSVEFAKSWDGAVEEARLLNVPIVVHSHGFY